MQVIAEVPPLNLEIIKKALAFRVRKGMVAEWGAYRLNVQCDEEEGNLKKKDKLEETILNYWKEKWCENEHGRITKRFIPDADFAVRFKPKTYCINLLTGYGSINGTSFARGAVDDPNCFFCKDEEENVEHMLFECPLYEEFRYETLKKEETQKELRRLIMEKNQYT
ncbi:reverse transcriptase [Lasius niger]|uniref:Reverse transcriptase n=1 Tax=Lasius niger TaxID=67767 RepID=A0A0J7KRX9_LASNI|nr:reverse transcriptase [Lasius niger]